MKRICILQNYLPTQEGEKKDTLALHAIRYSSDNSHTFANSTCFANSSHNVNIAVRVNESDDALSFPLPRLSNFWQDADKSPATDWNSWAELFEMVVLARHFKSISEERKTPTEQDPTILALLGNSTDGTATKEDVLYLSIGKTVRKMLTDKCPDKTERVLKRGEIVHWIGMRSSHVNNNQQNLFISTGKF